MEKKMKMDDIIARINELYHLSQNRKLTDEELEEQKSLRRMYIDSVKGNLQGQLDSIRVKNEDGTITPLKKREG